MPAKAKRPAMDRGQDHAADPRRDAAPAPAEREAAPDAAALPTYRRVLLKLSGESFARPGGLHEDVGTELEGPLGGG